MLSLCLCLCFVYFKDKVWVLTPKKKSTGFCFGEKKVFLFLFFKYCADVEKCESFKGFDYIYIYILIKFKIHSHLIDSRKVVKK